MDTNDQAQEEADALQSEVDALEAETDETKDTTDYKAKYEETKGQLKRALTKIEKSKIEKKAEELVEKKTGLDNGDLALLAVKGYEHEEDMDFIQDKMQKWNKTLPEILRDNDVIEKLKGMKIERDVKAAMPSATKRTSAGNLDNIDYWTAKYEKTGELPDNFEIRSAVINAQVEKHNTNKPYWRT